MRFIFKQWQDGDTTVSKSIQLTAGTSLTLTAYYVTAYTLTVSSTTGGRTDPVSAQYVIEQGKAQQVSAIPNTGYMFDHWELDGVIVGTVSPYTVTMNKDKTLLAVFVVLPPPPPNKSQLTISATVGGTTTPVSGTWEYDVGAQVLVRANPDNEYSFDHWEFTGGVILKDNPIMITMDADYSLHAVFTVKPIPIPLWKVGAIIASGIGGISVVGLAVTR